MAGGNPSNDPAPWEAPGKRHTQQFSAGGPPQPIPQPQSPYPAAPGPRPAPAAMPYPVPAATPSPYPYPAAPGPLPAPAPYPPHAAYPQPGAYPQPAAYPQPYGAAGFAPSAYPMAKPTSGMAIASLICAGLGFVVGFTVLVGVVLGVLALKETGPSGDKSGRGLAIAGIAVNSVMLALGMLLIIAIIGGAMAMSSQIEEVSKSAADGSLIVQRAEMYYRDKGDLASGGHRFIGGYKNADKTKGPLMVPDLVGPTELKLPIERYFLEIRQDSATVWYTDEDGGRQIVGTFSATRQASPKNSDWDWPD